MLKFLFAAALAGPLAASPVVAAQSQQTDADVQRLLNEYDACRKEGEDLDMRIRSFNERAEAFKAEREEVTTGSRIADVNAQPTMNVYYSSEEVRRLLQESAELQALRADHWDRCKKFNTRDGAE